jgi:pectate lyase
MTSLHHLTRCCWPVAITLGCGTEIAQTAEYRSPQLVDCSAPSSTVSLPDAVIFGGTDPIADTPLVSTNYNLGEGPGILVVARDAFRLYVNAELLLESTEPLVPRFVAYSFLPGRNSVSIVASGAGRTPLVAVRIDELERRHVSDGSWRTSVAPPRGWTNPEYDDRGWLAALDSGPADAQGNCMNAGSSFTGSGARWIGSPDPATTTVAMRYRLEIAPDGFGGKATGGGAAAIVVAKDVSTLRTAIESDDTARVVVVPEGYLDFRPAAADVSTASACPTACDTSSVTEYVLLPTGTDCSTTEVSVKRNERKIHVRSNKTIVGLGRGTQLRGAWFDLSNRSNIILRNLTWFDVNPDLIEAGDGLGLDGTAQLWVDHCTFKWISDGFTDLSAASVGATFSWVRFDGTNAAECRGRHLRSNEVIDSEATYHHCFWQHVDGRAPFVHGASARAHLYNNVVEDALDYAVGSGCQGQVLLEGSYFEEVAAPTNRRDCVETPGQLGLIRAVAGSNLYGAGSSGHLMAGVVAEEPHDVVFAPPYPYQSESATDIRFKVRERAGTGSSWALPISKD